VSGQEVPALARGCVTSPSRDSKRLTAIRTGGQCAHDGGSDHPSRLGGDLGSMRGLDEDGRCRSVDTSSSVGDPALLSRDPDSPSGALRLNHAAYARVGDTRGDKPTSWGLPAGRAHAGPTVGHTGALA